MAGHSKWANIQHRKGRQDEKRGKIWTRVIREITVAARQGGGDLGMNPRLRLAVDKAKAGQHAGRHASSTTSTRPPATSKALSYEEIRYEGYGIGGAAIIVDCMTDNRVRTVAEVRHAFSKYGGNIGTEGSVAFQFKHCGQFVFAPGTERGQGDGSGAGSRRRRRDHRRRRRDRGAVRAGRLRGGEGRARSRRPEARGGRGDDARREHDRAAAARTPQRMQKLLDVLEDLDDVQDVYHNAVIDE